MTFTYRTYSVTPHADLAQTGLQIRFIEPGRRTVK